MERSLNALKAPQVICERQLVLLVLKAVGDQPFVVRRRAVRLPQRKLGILAAPKLYGFATYIKIVSSKCGIFPRDTSSPQAFLKHKKQYQFAV